MAQTGHQYTPDDPVVAQYERWVLPAPVEDLGDPANAQYLQSFHTLRKLEPAYWPAGKPREDLDILVAGCGSMAAACFAYLYPKSRVVGIDISRNSLAHEERLKARHQLANLTLHHCPVEQVSSLAIAFDYISCHGVLHHLPDPVQGLRALGGVLRPNGVIAVMVYGKYGRAPVYVFQELFRQMGLGQTPEDVALVRRTLATLPGDHPLQRYIRGSEDLKTDAGIVDTFLHRRDRAYSAADCAALAHDAGMVFQGWERNYFYYPDGLFAGTRALRQRLDMLPETQLWEAMDMVAGVMGSHWFHVCRADRDAALYRIPWDSAAFLDCIPLRAAQLVKVKGGDGEPQWAMACPFWPPVPLTAAQAAIFAQVDGRRTVLQCLEAAGIQGDAANLPTADRGLFRLLWRTGFGLFRLSSPGRSDR